MPRPFSVLLVEDDDPLRAILVELLQARGWQIYSTDKGQEAVELARQHPLDFSILDLHLPGITGLEVFNHISQMRPLPSIMISGGASRQEAEAALQAGIFQFLRKPLAFDNLQHCLDQLIRHHFQSPPQGH